MSENFRIPQMETIARTAELFGLPPYFIRQKAISGEIVCVKAGRKYLINIEKFAEYLNGNKVTEKPSPVAASRISPIRR